jgi:hypothetical protein
MIIEEAVRIFFSGEKLIFGNERHIEARNMFRHLKRGTKDYTKYEFMVEDFHRKGYLLKE